MANRLLAPAPVYRDLAEQASEMNSMGFSRAANWYWFVRRTEKPNGEITETLEHIDMPVGTRGWLRENEARAKAYLRKVMGGEQWQIDQAYRLAIEYATEPKAWSNRIAR